MISSRTKESLIDEARSNPASMFGIIIFIGLIFLAVFAPIVAPFHPNAQFSEIAHQAPYGFGGTHESVESVDGEIVTVEESNKGTLTNVAGTDANGRDLASRALFGLRTSLSVAFIAILISTVIGTTVGIISGYYGDKIDNVLMRFVDIVLAFPTLLIALTLFSVVGPLSVQVPDPIVLIGMAEGMPKSFTFPVTVTIAISAVLWVWIARVARSEAIKLRSSDYVDSAKAVGMGDFRILTKHVLPNCITPILVMATVQMATVIILEAALSYLGFSGTTLSLGYDISQGRDYLGNSWWISTLPGIVIVAAVVSINFIGDWIRDALDPDVQRVNE